MITVEIADSQAERQQGLSDRDKLPPDRGLLFVFNEKDTHPFWMKGMRFNLDFIWIADNKVVDITENVPAPKNLANIAQIRPKHAVNYVLEVNAGFVKAHQISIGSKFEVLE